MTGITIIMEKFELPKILAPAGDEQCFLAALAAGADAIYLGLKKFSARMAAKNFDIPSLARLCELALRHDCRVEIAFNNMLKQDELEEAWRHVRDIVENTSVDGMIVQDPGMLGLVRQAGFKGNLTLSTLSAFANTASLPLASRMGFDRVVLPREFSIDEIRQVAQDCPSDMELECFVHGALCYSVSGRCWWSSYMGGKSGLRGQCVQPCRRLYFRTAGGKRKAGERFFACQDLQLGELVKLLLDIPQITTWKIEGRKKGPHYVYHVVTAYRILRDYPDNAQKRKMALQILEDSLGRTGVKARFLPRENRFPMAPGKPTGSGKLAGRVRNDAHGNISLRPMFDLLPKDYLRIGSQDERWHGFVPVSRAVPRGGTLTLKLPRHKTPPIGTPVFLVDRRDPELVKMLESLRRELEGIHMPPLREIKGKLKLPASCKRADLPNMVLFPHAGQSKGKFDCLKGKFLRAYWVMPKKLRTENAPDLVFWLPPIIWPDQEKEFAGALSTLLAAGAKRFVCNSPWQRAFFPKNDTVLELIAGPFCNIANTLILEELKKIGFSAAIISPELAQKDILALPAKSPLPLGFVLAAFWPVSLSRFGLTGIEPNEIFESPKGEQFWARNYEGTIWIYPGWPVNLYAKQEQMRKAGYSFFTVINENAPPNVAMHERQGLFNWDGTLL